MSEFTEREEGRKTLKRPHNAYNLFYMERNPIERKNNPRITGNEVSRLIGKKWWSMKEEERHVYHERAREISLKFKQEHPDYRYQKGSGNDRYGNDEGENGEREIMELHIRNVLAFLGCQAVIQHLTSTNEWREGGLYDGEEGTMETEFGK